MSRRETSSEIDDAAASWATRLDEADLDEAGRKIFDAWLAADVRHVGAFARARAVLVHIKRAKALGADFDPASFAADGDEGEAPSVDAAIEEEPEPSALLTRRRLLLGASAIAATAAMAIVVPTQEARARLYETGRGESRLVPLEDGSTVTLNTDSQIAVRIDKGRPAVSLMRGEALFKVAGAGRASFLVEVGGLSLRAQEATFAVCHLAAQPLEVKVCEGVVAFDRGASARRVLRANMQAVLADDGRMIERGVSPEALQRELAWQEGMLAFEDTPLGDAAREFARYSDRQIRIADPAVASETVTGRYAANNPEGFARAVALGLNLHVQAMAGGIIIAR